MAKFVPIEQEQAQPPTGFRFVPIEQSAQGASPRMGAATPRAVSTDAPGTQVAAPRMGAATPQSTGTGAPSAQDVPPRMGAATPRADNGIAGLPNDISPQGAPLSARYQFGLGSPSAQDPASQIELARRALGDDSEVRIGPQTEELEFKPPGAGQWTIFNPPGAGMGDITGGAPGGMVLGGGVVGGVAGFLGGSVAGPAGAGVGTVLGTGVGEGMGELIRLSRAADRGLIDLTPNEIMDRAMKRSGKASVATIVGGAAVGAFRRALAAASGVPMSLLDALGDRPMREVIDEAKKLSGRVESVTGDALPLTTGQVARSPEVIRAESAAMSNREVGSGLREIGEEQKRIVGKLDDATFGPPATPQDRAAIGRSLTTVAARNTRDAEGSLRNAESAAFATARAPEDAAANTRRILEQQREEVFAPLRRQFDDLQQEGDIRISFEPVRAEAARLRGQEGQDILRSISLQEQSRLLTEADSAGTAVDDVLTMGPNNVLEWTKQLVDNPPSLGETQRVLRDVRRELRRPSIRDEPQRERILKRMQDSIVKARNDSLDDDQLRSVLQLESQYADAARQIDQGIVGRFMEKDPRTGLFALSGEESVDRLLRGREVSQEFVDALGSLPNAQSALLSTQDSILGTIQRRFVNDETGRIDPNRLRTFLRNNKDSLEVLFKGRPEIVGSLSDARRAAVKLGEAEKTMTSLLNRMEKLVGLRTADPARLASEVLSNMGPRDAQIVRRLLPESRRGLFDRSLATNVRDSVTDSRGRLSADSIDQFLRSDQSLLTKSVLGDSFNENLGLVRDVLRVVNRDLEKPVPLDLSTMFARAQPGLQGIMRFARVPFAPLSARGRAFTASMGVASEGTQRALAKAMADPEKIALLADLNKVTLGSKAAEKILGRLGMEPFLELVQDDPLQGEPVEQTPRGDPQRGTLTP